MEFIAHVPLQAGIDPRRIDVRASLSDPSRSWLVRLYRQHASIAVVLVADLSASMAFRGAGSKLDALMQLAQALAFSAYRTGDSFGFIGCNDKVIDEFLLPPARACAAGPELAKKLARYRTSGTGAGGLVDAAGHLGAKRALLFLASDFHFPLAFLDRVLDTLARHEVVPLVLWDPAEMQAPSGFGWMELRDPETGRRRTTFVRPGLRRAWKANFDARREELVRRFSCRNLRPFFMIGEFRPDALTAHFFDYHASRSSDSRSSPLPDGREGTVQGAGLSSMRIAPVRRER